MGGGSTARGPSVEGFVGRENRAAMRDCTPSWARDWRYSSLFSLIWRTAFRVDWEGSKGMFTHLYLSSSIGFRSVTRRRPVSTSRGVSFSTVIEFLNSNLLNKF